MVHFIKKLSLNEFILAIGMLSLTAVLTYGLFLPQLGYYHDDWYMIWSGVSRGAGSLFSLFSSDRPFMGFIYVRLFGIFHENILAWHLAALAVRVAGAAAFYWILRLTWPRLKSVFVLATMLFITFPGFLSEPNAATKINHLIGYGAALFSIAFTLQAVVTRRRVLRFLFIGLSVLAMAFYLWIYEYMVGLEVMRISLLFWLYWQGSREKVKTAVKNSFLGYLPYIPVLLVFLYWRINSFESTRVATNLTGLVADYQSNFVNMMLRLVFQVLNDFFSSSVFAWFVQPYHLFSKAEYERIVIAVLTAAAVVLLTIAYHFARRKVDKPDCESAAPLFLILIGCLITLGAVFPVVLANRYLDLMDPYKSYGLHPSAGAIIILLGIVMMIKPKFRTILMISMLGLSVATQSLNIQDWAYYWDLQRNFWWQLTWRAPDIHDNTMVMGLAPEDYSFQQDYEVWGPVNLIYQPEHSSAPILQSEVLNQDTLVLIYEKKSFPTLYVRDIFLPRNYNNLLLISQPTTDSCIHAIDGKMPVYSPNERPIAQLVGEYSNIDFIETSSASHVPPAAIFGQEPEHGWCYYYQKAELSRQKGDWTQIVELYDMLVSTGLEPADQFEYFVFIEGLVNTGRVDEARKIAGSFILENAPLRYSICKGLAAGAVYPESYGYQRDQINQILCEVPVE